MDLVLIMGTALAVGPFNMIPWKLENCPQVLFNMENVTETSMYDFEKDNNRLLIKGKCDETIAQFCKDLGWEADFENSLPEIHKSGQKASE